MNFSFKKFIPKVMQTTKWGSLTEVWQSIYEDIREDEVRKIFSQYDFDTISTDDLYELAAMFGFNFKTLDGYTATLDFMKKEVLYIIPRLSVKTTQTCYQLQGVPFNLISTGYSVIFDSSVNKYNADETLLGTKTPGTPTLDREDRGYVFYRSLVNMDSNLSLDSSPVYHMDTREKVSAGSFLTLDESFIDFSEFPSLDGLPYLYSLTRNMVFNYIYKFAENSDEFLSLNTLKVLKSDIDQFKRVTDRCYFEPYLFFRFNPSTDVRNKIWTDYQGNAMFTQKSIFIGTFFENWHKIRFGIGAHTTIDTSITDVETFSFEYDYIDDTNKLIEELDHYNFRLLITEMQKISYFTEIAIIDISGNCVAYSTFPKVQWDPNMYTNIKFDFYIDSSSIRSLDGSFYLDGAYFLNGKV